VILLLLIVAALFVKFDYKVKGAARFVAYSEWTLSNVEQDKLIGSHVYNGQQNQHDMTLFHFQRPDFVRFSLNSDLRIGDIVEPGALIAQFMSSEDAMLLAGLKGSLEEAKANLAALRVGEKKAFQQEASQALTYAKAELAAYEPVLKRAKELHEKNLLSDQELEITQAQYDLYTINVSVQEARLQSVKTGEKAEAISVIEAQAKSLSDQLAIYQEKLDAAAIKSPVKGMLVQPDRTLAELCHICELDSMIVQMPIKASEIKNVQIGSPMIVNVSGSENVELAVSGINYSATMVMAQPMYIVSAVLANPDYTIKHGMTGNVEITTGKSTLFNMLAESWTSFRFNK
jgi:hypothetical protein